MQEALFAHGRAQHLLLLEHPHVFTYGPRTDLDRNVLVPPHQVGAELVRVKRGGDVTYHGPGQLVGYPIVSVANALGAADHVCAVQRVLVRSLLELGVPTVGCLPEYPGVWVDPDGPSPRKIAAIGVRLARGRTMHGFALNIATDMRYLRDYIIPCGIADRPVTSLAEEGIDVSMREVAEVVARHAAVEWGGGRARTSGRRLAPPTRRPVGVLAWPRPGHSGPHGLRPRCRTRTRALDRPPAAGGRRGRAHHRRAQAGVVASEGGPRSRGAVVEAHRPRPVAGDGVRRSGVSQPERVLGRWHGDVHGARRAMHAGVWLLPRRHAPARRPVGRRAEPCGRRRRPHATRSRGAHDGGA